MGSLVTSPAARYPEMRLSARVRLALGAGIGGQFYNVTISNNKVHGYSAGAGIAFSNSFSIVPILQM